MLLLLFSLFVSSVVSWPHLGRGTIGPTCTAGVHQWIEGACPAKHKNNEITQKEHTWPNFFVTQWNFYYIFDPNYIPPYNPIPVGNNITVTHGYTYYDSTFEGGAMREVYDTRCIPIFMDGVFAANNNFSCDFLNVASTKTAYLITHHDRPIGSPECCIIGQPFRPPPVDFAKNLTQKSQSVIDDITIDWNGINIPDSGGPFSYGFIADNGNQNPNDFSVPYAFYMMGAPQIASWMYQVFYDFKPIPPSSDTWIIPDSCKSAEVCPGWS